MKLHAPTEVLRYVVEDDGYQVTRPDGAPVRSSGAMKIDDYLASTRCDSIGIYGQNGLYYTVRTWTKKRGGRKVGVTASIPGAPIAFADIEIPDGVDEPEFRHHFFLTFLDRLSELKQNN